MLSNKTIICPENLLKIAKDKGPVKAVIVNAVKAVAIESAKKAVEANLIIPVFVGAGLKVNSTFFPVCKPTPVARITFFNVRCLIINYS